MEHQVCKVCLLNKELTSKNYTSGTNRRNGMIKSYWYKTCKICDRDRVLAKIQRYKVKNRKTLADKQKEYYQNNKESCANYHKIYYQNNKEYVKEKAKNSIYSRRKNDPLFKLKENISCNIRNCIAKNNQPLQKYLPYTIQELKTHLEKQFEPWMNWKNHGTYRLDIWDDTDSSTWTWQVDHIIPHSMFKYTSMEDQEFKECWKLSNLRPYSAKQNIIDGARL